MTEEWKFKVQAYLDGELSPREARRVEKRLAEDSEARGLLKELNSANQLLAGFEQTLNLPESREFYWSKVERSIQAQSNAAEAPAKVSMASGWRKFLLPGAAIAALALVVAVTRLQFGRQPTPRMQAAESTVADSGAFTYQDFKVGATLLWLSYPAQKEFAANP